MEPIPFRDLTMRVPGGLTRSATLARLSDSEIQESRNRSRNGFSMVELLCVVTIMSMLMMFSGVAITGLNKANAVNKAIFDVSGIYECARTCAMANSTYVRVGISQINANTGGNARSVPVTVITAIYSAHGSLTDDADIDMSSATKWPLMSKPLILENFCIYDNMNATKPDTSNDVRSSATDIASFIRPVATAGSVEFRSIVQFDPHGDARVIKAESVRYIKISLDQPAVPQSPDTPRQKNPFILRISGNTGNIDILRKENM